jgi:membrane peptidoglycan carboxypeptidase
LEDDGSFRAFRLLTIFSSPHLAARIPGLVRAGAMGLPRFRLRRPGFHDLDPRGSIRKVFFWTTAIALVWAVVYEMRTSALQSRLLAYYAGRMSFRVEQGPSDSIVFPTAGPLDQRRGYTLIPEFEKRLASRGFSVFEQARFSPEMLRIARWGIAPPYREPARAELTITGLDGTTIFRRALSDRLFRSYEHIPPLVVQALLLMENRELGESSNLYENPVVEWDRLAKAGLLYAGHKIGLPLRREGGSTLATQIEKFQHSAQGRTTSVMDKLAQMAGATLKVYRAGRDTRVPRREIIVDYLNGVPLAAVPGYGELHGIGDGLKGWFGVDLNSACDSLREKGASPAKAQAFKRVLTLLAAVRAPSYYLLQDRAALERRVDFYVSRLEEQGILNGNLAGLVRAVPVVFSPPVRIYSDVSYARLKASNALRIRLLDLLGVPGLYDLDRLHLEARSTIDVDLQNNVAAVFEKMHDPEFLDKNGLRQEQLLLRGDPAKVVYSLLLYERTPSANLLRVQTDSLERPFDLNTGIKMELGSTAKLRTLAHYLDMVAQLHKEMSPLTRDELRGRARKASDPITRWVAETLATAPGGKIGLDALLSLALERKYSASPGESFFTGGGLQTFGNFDPKDNGRTLTIREATQRSVNLVYIRLMRDLVKFHEARLPYDMDEVMINATHPVRMRILGESAENEAEQIMMRSFKAYERSSRSQILARFLGSRARSAPALTILFFAWKPDPNAQSDPEPALARWLATNGAPVSGKEVKALIKAYGNPRLNLLDYAYLLRRHPLDLFCAGALSESSALSWKEVWRRGGEARKLAANWLFNTRHKRAQELRLRIQFEEDAFKRMTPYWQKLGFPFARLTPSYATAIGSSSDRPSALAELMGIILNDGVRLPAVDLEELRFARGTPYQTVFSFDAAAPQQEIDRAVARALRGVLAEVVQLGTARRIDKAFVNPDRSYASVGGKTGSGDNRFESFARGGQLIGSRVVNRTAAFVFYVGDRFFGVILACVPGSEAAAYKFTSALPVSVLKLLAPEIDQRLR